MGKEDPLLKKYLLINPNKLIIHHLFLIIPGIQALINQLHPTQQWTINLSIFLKAIKLMKKIHLIQI